VGEADAFDNATFLGLSRPTKRDPYRLSLFARHLKAGERARAIVPIRGGTLLVTDRRLLELRPHLEVHGAWNVKEFLGYEVVREVDLKSIHEVEHMNPAAVAEPTGPPEESLLVRTAEGTWTIVVARGPEPTLTHDDVRALRAIVEDGQAK